MDADWKELYKRALEALNPRACSDLIEAGSVAAALQTEQGNIYVGVCVDTPCTLGICAERNAIFNMITNGEHRIKRIIAVSEEDNVLPPCGACRELMAQLMPNDYYAIEVMTDYANEQIVSLSELLPNWWMQ